jgi:hypothetical protein
VRDEITSPFRRSRSSDDSRCPSVEFLSHQTTTMSVGAINALLEKTSNWDKDERCAELRLADPKCDCGRRRRIQTMRDPMRVPHRYMATNDLCTELNKDIKVDASMERRYAPIQAPSLAILIHAASTPSGGAGLAVSSVHPRRLTRHVARHRARQAASGCVGRGVSPCGGGSRNSVRDTSGSFEYFRTAVVFPMARGAALGPALDRARVAGACAPRAIVT